MESRVVDNRVCHGKRPSDAAVAMAVGSKEGVCKGEDYADTKSLLPVARVKGGMGGRRRRSLRRKVQWNDRNGNKLAEVREFDPRVRMRTTHLRVGPFSGPSESGMLRAPGCPLYPKSVGTNDSSDSDDENADSCFCAIM